MDVMHERCAGLDVHKATIVACVRTVTGGKVNRECRTFDTTTAGLLALLAWLHGIGLHSRGDGGDRRLLEAGMEHPQRRRLRTDAGERGPHQERPRPQDGRQRRHVDRRFDGLRPDQGELRSGRGDLGAAFAAARPQDSRPASRPATSSAFRRRWRRPTSSSTRSSAIFSASADGG